MSYDPNQPYSGYGAQEGQPSPQEPTQYAGSTAYNAYGPPPAPQYPLPQQQYVMFPPPPPSRPRSSLRWLWITLGILAGVIVLSCGGCLLALNAAGVFASPNTTVNDYYSALQKQDYQTAYSYLSIGTLTVAGQDFPATPEAYAQLAQALDREEGPVTSYRIADTTNDGTTATVTAEVTRAQKGTYTVTLQLERIGTGWKIVGFDDI